MKIIKGYGDDTSHWEARCEPEREGYMPKVWRIYAGDGVLLQTLAYSEGREAARIVREHNVPLGHPPF